MRLWCVVAPATTHNNYHRLCRDDPFYAQAGAVDLEYQTLLHITASTFHSNSAYRPESGLGGAIDVKSGTKAQARARALSRGEA